MNFSVLQFPASNCDQDAVHAVRLLGHSARLVWHKDASLGDTDVVIVPGGFSPRQLAWEARTLPLSYARSLH